MNGSALSPLWPPRFTSSPHRTTPGFSCDTTSTPCRGAAAGLTVVGWVKSRHTDRNDAPTSSSWLGILTITHSELNENNWLQEAVYGFCKSVRWGRGWKPFIQAYQTLLPGQSCYRCTVVAGQKSFIQYTIWSAWRNRCLAKSLPKVYRHTTSVTFLVKVGVAGFNRKVAKGGGDKPPSKCRDNKLSI